MTWTSPSRREALRILGAGAAGLATGPLTGCAAGAWVPWDQVRVQPLEGDPPAEPLPPDADELARRELLGDVEALGRTARTLAGSPDTTAERAAALQALLGAFEEQGAALRVHVEPPRAPTADLPDPPDLAGALSAAALRALAHLEAVTGPMARLVAAVAAGHEVAAVVLTGPTDQAQAPHGVPPAPVAARPPATLPNTPPNTPPVTPPVTPPALAAAIDAEGAAQYGYGVVAVHLAEPLLSLALAERDVHDRAIDDLVAALAATGAPPHPPAGAYGLPAPVVDSASAVLLAVAVEDAAADAWADLVAAGEPGQRAVAAATLAARAQQAAAWRVHAGLGLQLRAMPGISGRT